MDVSKLTKSQLKYLQENYIKPPKKSTRAPLNYEDKYPEGMKNFVKQWISLEWRGEIQDKCSFGGELYRENVDMRYIYFFYLIKRFLNTQFKDKSIFKSVSDLPHYDRYLAIDCLGCYLGMSPHNGNIHLLQIVAKYKELQ